MEKNKNLQEKIYNAKVTITDAINEEAKKEETVSLARLTALSEALKSLFEVQPSNLTF